MHTASRYHDISCGHRVAGHETKCRHLHGHNYRIHFHCQVNSLDKVGRVIDFSVIKEKLCMWVENNWDHKFLAWKEDPVITMLHYACTDNGVDVERQEDFGMFRESVVFVPFNPTAENMAEYLVLVVGPKQLEGTGVSLVKCTIEETAKCHASFTI